MPRDLVSASGPYFNKRNPEEKLSIALKFNAAYSSVYIDFVVFGYRATWNRRNELPILFCWLKSRFQPSSLILDLKKITVTIKSVGHESVIIASCSQVLKSFRLATATTQSTLTFFSLQFYCYEFGLKYYSEDLTSKYILSARVDFSRALKTASSVVTKSKRLFLRRVWLKWSLF